MGWHNAAEPRRPGRQFSGHAEEVRVVHVRIYRNAWARCECTPELPFPLIHFYVHCRAHKALEYVSDVPCCKMTPCDQHSFQPAAFAAATALFALAISASEGQYRRLKRAAIRLAAAVSVGKPHQEERSCRTCDACPEPVRAIARYARTCFGDGNLRTLLLAARTPASKRSRWVTDEERRLVRTPSVDMSDLMLPIVPLAIGVCDTCWEAELLMRELYTLGNRYSYSRGKFYRQGARLSLLKGLSSFVSEALQIIAERSALPLMPESGWD